MTNYSVLMSVYDKAEPKALRLSIESMLAQTYPPEQFILVWDGPVRDTLKDVVARFSVAQPGLFTIVDLPENHGLAYALNAGLAEARNELVARMDSDDYALPERCEKQVLAFERDDKLDILGTNIALFEGSIVHILGTTRDYPTDREMIKNVLRRNDPFSHPTVMYKRDAVLGCGGYDPQLRRRQDYDLFSRMIVGADCVGENLSERLLLFRADADYLKRNRNSESCNNRLLVQKKIWKRGNCSLFDYVYVWLGITVSRLIPRSLYAWLYDRLKGSRSK